MHRVERLIVISAGLWLTLLAAAGGMVYAQSNPVPLINQPLVPDAVAPGGQSFTLTVNGTGFVPGSVVQWNGTALTTTYVRGSELTATVPASDVTIPGTGWITVASPGTGAASNVDYFQVSPLTPSVAFSGSAISTATGPTAIITADFNRDGRTDLAFVDGAGSGPEVYVLLGNGDGTFGAATAYSSGGAALYLTAADFNNDGVYDLAVTNSSQSTVGILLGNGDGTFTAPLTFAVEVPAQVIAGDVNGDGRLDLICQTADGLSVLLGNGDGTFGPAGNIAISEPFGVMAGDFNRDGILDLVVGQINTGDVLYLQGKGDGTFAAATGFQTGFAPVGISVADFNGDGNLDVVAISGNGNQLSVLLGNGDGTFQAFVLYETGSIPADVITGDFNSDGRLDLAVSCFGDGTISILLGNGDGTFQPFVPATAGKDVIGLTAADFNGDGRLDVASADRSANTLSILLQQALVTFSPPSLTFPTEFIQGKSLGQTVTLRNGGSTALEISSIAVTGSDSTSFLEKNDCGTSVPAGASCTITVTFAPKAQGTLSATVTVSTPSGNPGFVVSGTGTESKLTPAWMNFGSLPVGQTSSPQNATLTNTGSTLLRINMDQGIRLVGSGAKNYRITTNCGFSLQPGQTCTIAVTFMPDKQGALSAQVQVNDNGTGHFAVYQYVTLARVPLIPLEV